jgi:hypothetical protein
MFRIVVLTILIALSACEKDMSITGSYVYGQTQCADKWQSGATTAETLTNLKYYLAGKGIEVADARLTDAPADRFYCMACSCPTGRVYIIKVNKGTKAQLEAEGFTLVD